MFQHLLGHLQGELFFVRMLKTIVTFCNYIGFIQLLLKKHVCLEFHILTNLVVYKTYVIIECNNSIERTQTKLPLKMVQ